MTSRQSEYRDKDPKVNAGLQWNAPTASIRDKDVEAPGVIDGFLRRVDEEISRKQAAM